MTKPRRSERSRLRFSPSGFEIYLGFGAWDLGFSSYLFPEYLPIQPNRYFGQPSEQSEQRREDGREDVGGFDQTFAVNQSPEDREKQSQSAQADRNQRSVNKRSSKSAAGRQEEEHRDRRRGDPTNPGQTKKDRPIFGRLIMILQ